MAEQLWVPDEAEAWVPGTVRSRNADGVVVDVGGQQKRFSGREAQALEPVVAGSLTSILDNLVHLEAFSEGSILHQVKQRFLRDDIYTYVGAILVAVNPFRALPIYGQDEMDRHRRLAGAPAASPPPHVYAIGALAYHNLCVDRKSQSVLISGESGAGKTETTKKILAYLAQVAGQQARRASLAAGAEQRGRGGVTVEQQILQSNPVLESFGNAKTGRNNNSSRFGKWMEIDMTGDNRIQGCRIDNYLLEKSRVVVQTPGERNYHVFYMLCAGATPAERQRLFLQPAAAYRYLNRSGCMDVAGRDDVAEYREMRQAMDVLHFTDEMQDAVLRVLAGILQLGNLEFVEGAAAAGGDDSSAIANRDALRAVAALLGVGESALEQCLVSRLSSFGSDETILIPLSVAKAGDMRDAFAKALYGRMFDWLVQRVNDTLFKGKTALHIGVLDIFGFEVFEVNSFEQLCINYANEKLQAHFNDCIFRAEIAAYQAEDVPSESITFQDNHKCIELLEMKHRSVLAMVDEEVVVPRGSDSKYANKLHKTFAEDQATQNPFYKRNRRRPLEFIVCHFAGEVSYVTDGFLEKNKDAVSDNVVALLARSQLQLLCTCFPREEAGAKKKIKTLAGQFRNNLSELMATLQSTEPHFIRCVKPNAGQQPRTFEGPLSLRQLKYAGLFEAIRIRKAGYAFRVPHADFFGRYRMCAPHLSANPPADMRAGCQQLLNSLKRPLPAASFAIGRTLVFLRTAADRAHVEEERNQAVAGSVIVLQKWFRYTLKRLKDNKHLWEVVRRRREIEAAQRLEEEQRAREEAERRRKQEELEAKRRAEKAERERRERERIELERLQAAKRVAAVVQLQAIVRGRFGRKRAERRAIAVQLETATSARDPQLLRDAIARAKQARALSGPGISRPLKRARAALHKIEAAAAAQQQLRSALETGDQFDIEDALELVEELGVRVDGVDEARDRLLFVERQAQATDELKLALQRDPVMHGDELFAAIQAAIEVSAAPSLVRRAQGVYEIARPQLELRNRLRLAVERADADAMRAGVTEVQQYRAVHSQPSFCSEEVEGARMMLKMFRFEKELKDRGRSAGPERMPLHHFELCHRALAQGDAEAAAELRALCGGDPAPFVRCYKWVRAFAVWKFPRPASASASAEGEGTRRPAHSPIKTGQRSRGRAGRAGRGRR